MTLLVIYIIGFILSLLFLSRYGEKIGIGGYDEPKTYVNYDDYSSNASAFTAFSLIWPIFYGLLLIVGIRLLLITFTQFLITINKK